MDALRRLYMGHERMGGEILANRPAATARLKALFGESATAHGFSKDFHAWCERNGFAKASWLTRAGFGGRVVGNETVRRNPVILLPGNGCDASFMEPAINELLAQGYKRHEIYAPTYNLADPHRADKETHAPEYVRAMRDFIDAVTKYTGRRPKVVGHSMGSTIAQLAIHGVTVDDSGQAKRFAPKADVKTFIGAAGANQGLESCRDLIFPRVSNEANGFHPNATIYKLLAQLPKCAENVYAIYAKNDELLQDNIASARVKDQDGEVVLNDCEKAHLAPITVPEQLVRLLRSGDASVTSFDRYEAQPRKFATGRESAIASAFDEAQDSWLSSAHHLMRAGFLATTNPQDALWRTAAAGATFVFGVKRAVSRLPGLPLAMVSEALSGKQGDGSQNLH